MFPTGLFKISNITFITFYYNFHSRTGLSSKPVSNPPASSGLGSSLPSPARPSSCPLQTPQSAEDLQQELELEDAGWRRSGQELVEAGWRSGQELKDAGWRISGQ